MAKPIENVAASPLVGEHLEFWSGPGTLFEPLGRTRNFLGEATSDVADHGPTLLRAVPEARLLTDRPSHKGSAVAGHGLREDGLEVILDRVL